MPHITIEMFPGRDEEAKMELALEMQKCLSEKLGIDESVVSVSIKDIEKADWKAEVYDELVRPGNKEVFIKPGYKM